MTLTQLIERHKELEQKIVSMAIFGIIDTRLTAEFGDVSFQIRQIENPHWLREAA